MEWMIMPLQRYADFSGRSRRKEYWMFVLLLIVIAVAGTAIDTVLGLPKLLNVYGPALILLMAGLLIPSLACAVRRFHDQDRSGWFVLLGYGATPVSWVALATGNMALVGVVGLIGGIGSLIFIVFMFLEGTRGPNRFGPDPKGGDLGGGGNDPLMGGPQQI